MNTGGSVSESSTSRFTQSILFAPQAQSLYQYHAMFVQLESYILTAFVDQFTSTLFQEAAVLIVFPVIVVPVIVPAVIDQQFAVIAESCDTFISFAVILFAATSFAVITFAAILSAVIN